MKTFVKLFGVVAGMAALLASCNKQENPSGAEGRTIEMTIVASSDETKTVMGSDGAVTWSDSGEKLAVIEAATTNSETTTAKETSSDGVTTDGGATMTFGVKMPSKTAGSFSYYALYPNSAYVEKPTDLTNVKVNLASTQAPTESSFGPSADVLVAKPVTGLNAQPTELNLQFARVVAIGKMTIKNLNTDENVQKVTFTAEDKAVTGKSYINFTNAKGVEYEYSTYGVDNVVLDYSGKTIAANGMTAIFTCWPFALAANETFSVVVETENYTFTKDITLAEGKSLAFNVGRASAFNVSFDGIEGVAKAPVVQLVEDGTYVVASTTNMMTVGTSSNKYRDVATLPEKANEDNSYSVDATAAWNFVYDAATDTYKINSASDNALYIQGSSTGSDFKLVAETDATSFSITKKDDGTFKIGITSGSNTRYIGYNTQSPRFAMYAASSNLPVDLNLYPAKIAIIPKITVQKTLSVPSAETTSNFPVTLTNVESAEVNVYKDEACTIKETEWITANLNSESTAVEYYALENTTSEARTAYIKIYALSPDASVATAIVTVTQAASGGGETDWSKTYTSNVKISGATVIIGGNKYDAIQVGTSKNSGSKTFKVPANTTKLYLHVVGWNGEGGKTHTIKTSVGTISSSSIITTADSGASGSSPFTLSGNDYSSSNYFYEFTLSGVTSEATITISNSAKNYRGVYFGINAE